MTVEAYRPYLAALTAALPACDGILASRQPLEDLTTAGAVGPGQRSYLSINRTGLAGSVFELDDRLVTTVAEAEAAGWTGIKHMTRIDLTDPLTAPALELLGQVIDDSRMAGMEALIESLWWTDGAMARDTESIVRAAVIAHDMGAPLLKVPVPDVAGGRDRIAAVTRVVESVGVPVLFLGGPRGTTGREAVLAEVADAMAGGAAGLAIGRLVFEDPDPAEMAKLVADVVHGG
jgi:DhnA family fructose-bisphosphate aldolase class Ia